MSGENGGGTPHLRIVLGVVFLLASGLMFFENLESGSAFVYFGATLFFVLGMAIFSPRFGQLLLNAVWKLFRGTKKQVVAAAKQDLCEIETENGTCASRAIWVVTVIQDRQKGAPSFYAGRGIRCCNEHHPVIWDESPPEDFQSLGKKATETKRMLNKENVRPERIIMIPRLY